MKEIDLDIWFYNLPARHQEEITGISLSHYGVTDEIDGTYTADPCYEYFDNAVADWWNELLYEEKLFIYEREK